MTAALAVVLLFTTIVAVAWALRTGKIANRERARADASEDELVKLRREIRDRPEVEGREDTEREHDPYREAGSMSPDRDRLASLISENTSLRQELEVAKTQAEAERAIQALESQQGQAELKQQLEVARVALEEQRFAVTSHEAGNEHRRKRWESDRERLERDNAVLATVSPEKIRGHFTCQADALEAEKSKLDKERLEVEAEREREAVRQTSTEVEALIKKRTEAMLDARLLACRQRQQEIDRLLPVYREIVSRAQ